MKLTELPLEEDPWKNWCKVGATTLFLLHYFIALNQVMTSAQ